MHHGIIFGLVDIRYPNPEDNHDNWKTKNIYNWGTWTPSRSFGAHKIATHLRQQGNWDVEVLDFFSLWSYDELYAFIDSRIHKDTVFVGFSTMFGPQTWQLKKQHRIARYIRKKYPHVALVAGGMQFNCFADVNADYYVKGRGENGIVALLKWLTRSGPMPKMTYIRARGKWNNKRYNVVDCVEDYPAHPKPRVQTIYEDRDYILPNETLTTELSRGCRFACRFCHYYPLAVKDDYTRDADDFENEMRDNYDRFGVTNYLLSDETINDRTEKLEKFGAICKSLPFDPVFHGYMRADLLVTRGQREWDAALEMGIVGHWYGIESFHEKASKFVGKGMKPDRMKQGLFDIEDYFTKNSPTGYFDMSASLIMGLPYEPLESIRATNNWLNEHWSHRLFDCYPYVVYWDRNPDANSWLETKAVKPEHVYGHQDVLGYKTWIHPTEGYTEYDMYTLEEEYYKNRPIHMAGIWRLPWVTVTGQDPKKAFVKRGETYDEPLGSYNIWKKMVEEYKYKKLSSI